MSDHCGTVNCWYPLLDESEEFCLHCKQRQADKETKRLIGALVKGSSNGQQRATGFRNTYGTIIEKQRIAGNKDR